MDVSTGGVPSVEPVDSHLMKLDECRLTFEVVVAREPEWTFTLSDAGVVSHFAG